MKHYVSADFWQCYNALPEAIRKQADQAFEYLKRAPHYSSLRFKKAGRFWSARVTASYRALAVESNGDLVWFWIGTHDEYDKIIG